MEFLKKVLPSVFGSLKFQWVVSTLFMFFLNKKFPELQIPQDWIGGLGAGGLIGHTITDVALNVAKFNAEKLKK